MELKDLVGEHILNCVPNVKVRHPFNEEAKGVAFELDGKTYFAFEDAEDDCRSQMKYLVSFNGSISMLGGIAEPLVGDGVKVSCRMNYKEKAEILEFWIKETGHLLFSIGTDRSETDYPYFCVLWSPETLGLRTAAQPLRLIK